MLTSAGNPDHFGGARVKAKRPSIQTRAGHSARVRHQLLVDGGVPFDFFGYGFTDSEAGGVSEPAPHIVVTITEMIGREGPQVYADLMDADNGLVEFDLPESVTSAPGVWLMEFAVLTADEARVFVCDAYLYVERSAQAGCFTGPPTIPEVRLFLRDFAQENELLDTVDFDGSEIALAADLCVAEWNEIPPPDGPQYTTSNFPYRRHWLVGISAYLFGIAAEHYARNSLAYQAGGVNADDKGKHQLYMQKAAMARQEWRQFAGETKIIDSVNSSYAVIPGNFW